jgi:cytochrome c peroxidase
MLARHPMRRLLLPCLVAALAACRGGTDGERARPVASATAAPAETSTAAPAASAAPAGASPRVRAAAREGSTIARAPAGDALYVADEDRGMLYVVSLPLEPTARPLPIVMPGQPAQVLALADRVLVTIRSAGASAPGKVAAEKAAPSPPSAEADASAPPPAAPPAPPARVSAGADLLVPSPTGPGLLLSFRRDADRGLVETARVELPQDAWGVAVSPDGATAMVTSAWTHKVSAVDLAAGKVLWSIDVPREPRAVVVRADGRAAYVTHLTGAGLTRIDDLAGPPKVRAVVFPPSPLRTPLGVRLGASLAYSAALSPDGRRLFVPRHALGALGSKAWFGAATVDVLLTGDDTPQAPYRREGIGGIPPSLAQQEGYGPDNDAPPDPMGPGHAPVAQPAPFAQPRAVAYLEGRQALLVLGEGTDSMVELDARAVDPAMFVLATYALAQAHEASIHVATACGAPSGIAVSADEQTAWIHCRSTGDVLAVVLGQGAAPGAPRPLQHLADDPLPAEAALGRRLFYNATDSTLSGGLGCAGCHPDGRDDGHVWRETLSAPPAKQEHMTFVSSTAVLGPDLSTAGVTRQTPMLAGRVTADGPYGWHGESRTLTERLVAGFSLHRWDEPGAGVTDKDRLVRASPLQAYLRAGLVPPPHEDRPLTAKEKRGSELFLGDETACWTCHSSAPEYTNRKAYPVFPDDSAPESMASFDTQPEYKTPSLRFVGGTPPYLHDGRFSTLAALVQGNDDHMGKTNQLSASDKAALVAFLETL